MLGKIIATPVNLLILDEPTNHLDMESCDALLAAIDNFEGVVIIATHNEMFLHALADRLIVFQDDKIEVFDGNYQRFLDKGGWKDEETLKPAHKNNNKAESHTKRTRKESRRRRSEIITERGKVLKPLEDRITEVEDEIEAFEKQLEELHATMLEASWKQDGLKIGDLSQSIHNCQSAIDRRFDELETLVSTLEEHRKAFAKKLQQLE
jgi:ATP-binding cassette subfamily F protein 3